MSPKTCIKIVFLFILTLKLTQSHAQDSVTYSPGKIYYWGGGHIGAGSYALNLGLDAGMLIGNKIIVAYSDEHNDNILSHTDAREANAHSLMVGYKLTNQPRSNLSVLAGLSALKFTDRGEQLPGPIIDFGPERIYRPIGVPVMLRYTLVPAPAFGMDFSASANFNSHRTIFQLTFGIALGHLRDSAPRRKH